MKKKYKWNPAKFAFNMLILAGVIWACVFAYNRVHDMMYPMRYEQYISTYARENHLDKFMVAAVIRTESNFVHDAHSGKARGLMQLTDETAEWIASKMKIDFHSDDVENPETNIKMGCWYLRFLIDKYNDIDTALAAYNGGMGNVSKWLADERYTDNGRTLKYIPFEETREYVKKVNHYRRIYEEKYKDIF